MYLVLGTTVTVSVMQQNDNGECNLFRVPRLQYQSGTKMTNVNVFGFGTTLAVSVGQQYDNGECNWFWLPRLQYQSGNKMTNVNVFGFGYHA